MTWTVEAIPDQTGRTVLVTGATSGLGLASAVALAGAGARVLLGARDAARGKAALQRVLSEGGPDAELVELDLADLASVRRAAADVRERTGDALHLLLNNAGVMATPPRRTVDGFELQIGTNHLGHGALTWLLMPALRRGGAARVVTLASLAHRGGGLDVDDLHFTRRRYVAGRAYSQSKLANLLFATELDRRLRAAHPGVTGSQLFANSVAHRSPLLAQLAVPLTKLFTQDVRTGALPQLYAATAPQVRGGDYIGPGGLGELYGPPAPARRSAAARDEELARRLWRATADATGVQPDPD